MASSDEEEIRLAVEARLRQLMPAARIVHELNVCGQGSNRIDVAAISRQAIVAVEIKSKKDTLKRLSEQWTAFSKAAHVVIVAAHEKHFIDFKRDGERADVPPRRRLNHPEFLDNWSKTDRVWRFPRPEQNRDCAFWDRGPTWTFDPVKDTRQQPSARAMLGMLWAEELRAECHRHGVAATSRSSRSPMIADLVWSLTGREVVEAVCRQLRAREFARADPVVAHSEAA